MLHLVHMPSGRVINVGDSIEDGFVRITDSFTPCVRLTDGHAQYSLFKGSKFRDYQVIGD